MNRLRRLRFILNTTYSGPQAWFFIADDRGYFRDAGLEVEFTQADMRMAGIDLLHVPYKGAGMLQQDLAAGVVDLQFEGLLGNLAFPWIVAAGVAGQ